MDNSEQSLLFHQNDTSILGGQSRTSFVTNRTTFYPANPCYRVNLSVCVAVLTKFTTMHGRRLHRYFIRKQHGDWEGNQSHIYSPTSPHSIQPTHVLEQTWVCWRRVFRLMVTCLVNRKVGLAPTLDSSLLLSSYATNIPRTTHSRSLNQCGCPKITVCPTRADLLTSRLIGSGSFARLTWERIDWPRHVTALLPMLMNS